MCCCSWFFVKCADGSRKPWPCIRSDWRYERSEEVGALVVGDNDDVEEDKDGIEADVEIMTLFFLDDGWCQFLDWIKIKGTILLLLFDYKILVTYLTVTWELVTLSVPPFWNCCCWNDIAGFMIACVDSFALFWFSINCWGEKIFSFKPFWTFADGGTGVLWTSFDK